LLVWCPGPFGSCSPVCPLGVLCCVCGVLGHLAPAHRCVRSVCCVVCAVSWATWLLFTGVPARCAVLRVRCPGPLGSCTRMCPRGVLFACAVSWATWLLFTGVPARCVKPKFGPIALLLITVYSLFSNNGRGRAPPARQLDCELLVPARIREEGTCQTELAMKVVRQARLELSGGSTPDQLRPFV
jgi:hypothetical protein